MKVLVTGSTGYIGSALIGLLLNNGYEVWGLDAGFFTNDLFCPFPNHNIEKYYALREDIRKIGPNIMEGVDAVIHLAALSNDPLGNLNPFLTYEINYLGTVRLAAMAKSCGVKRFIFSSSCSVYGTSSVAATETFPTNPLTMYAEMKLKAEQELSIMASPEFCPVFLRNATVFGLAPRLRTDLVINNLLSSAFTTKQILLQSTGNACRPFIHVKDLANVFLSMLEVDTSTVYNQVFNIGSNYENRKIIDIAHSIRNHHPECEISFVGNPQPDKRDYLVDFTKFSKYFPDFKFKYSLDHTINELWVEFERQKFTVDSISQFSRLDSLLRSIKRRQLTDQLYWRMGEHAIY